MDKIDEKELQEYIDKLIANEDTDNLFEKIKTFTEDFEEEEELKSKGIFSRAPVSFKQVKGQEYEEAKNIRKDIENDAETWAYRPQQYYRPQSLKGLTQAIEQAKYNGLKVRAIGSRHSFSEVIAIGEQNESTWDIVTEYGNRHRSENPVERDVNGAYLDLTQTIKENWINNERGHPLDPKKAQLPIQNLKNREHTNKYYNVINGLKVSMVNDLLCNEKDKNVAFHTLDFDSKIGLKYRSLYNTGGGAIQRFAGAFSTGTHGSGGFISTYHDTIRSIVLVDSDGIAHRIEPKDGITDPAKHQAYYAANSTEVKVNLIQDDDKFYATIVSMGCFGIIYSVIIEVMPAARLYEQGFYSEKKDNGVEKEWSLETAQKIAQEIKTQYVEMYAEYNKKPNPSLNDVKKLQDKLKFDYFYVNPYLCKGKRNYIRKTNTYTRELHKGKRAHRKFWPTFFGEIGLFAKVIRYLFNSSGAPRPDLINQALNALRDNADTKGKGYIDLSYKVWNQGTGKMATIGVSIEYAVPIDKFPAIFQELLNTLQREGETDKGYSLDGPIALRFARASKGYLAPNAEKYYARKNGLIDKNSVESSPIYCYIELITLPNERNAIARKKQLELYKYIQNYFTIKGCRPHWGLNMGVPLNKQILSEMYPNFDKWLATYKYFNKDGTFDNQFTINAGLRDGDDADPIIA